MSIEDRPHFDRAALAHVLDRFERAGPAAPEGVAEFCDTFESWIRDQAAAGNDVGDYCADLFFIRGMLYTAEGNYEKAIENLDESIRASKRTGNFRRQIFGLCSIATCFEYAAMQEQASKSIFEALELADELGDPRLRYTVVHGLTALYALQGAYEQMLESALRGLAIAEALNDRRLLLRAYGGASLACAHLKRIEEGFDFIWRGLALVEDDTQSFMKTYLQMNLMFLLRQSGRLDEAVRLAEEHLDGVTELPVQHAAVLYVDVADLHLAVGNIDRAQEMLAMADSISDPKWMKAHLLEYYRVSAELYEAKGELARALDYLQRRVQFETEVRGRQAHTRLVALERHFAAELAARTDEVHHLRTVELVGKNEQLSNLINEKEKILHVVVNDLKNPLAATRLLSDALLNELEGRSDDRATELVRSIKSATVDMGHAVARLLASEEPRWTDRVQPLDLTLSERLTPES